MRIRQVRPEIFTYAVVSRLPAPVRLTYIGLWCVADDAGWMTWDVPQIAAQLYPYESVRVRERRVAVAGVALREAGRLVWHECHCAFIPKLADHQKIGGNKSFTARDKHRVHTVPDLSPGKLGNGRVGNGTSGASARENDDEYRAGVVKAYRRQGLPVDA
jgi:hypothetical protein